VKPEWAAMLKGKKVNVVQYVVHAATSGASENGLGGLGGDAAFFGFFILGSPSSR
jgi:hypothetical protein